MPMFITHRKDLKKDGTNPTMLYGYGGFDISRRCRGFVRDVPAFLERGGVWVTANMRGGGEYGEAWHEAGMFEKKQNVFDDFIAAAEYLVKENYASPQTLGIMGGSNGGLLVGAVKQQRPELFAVALPAVGVMDMLRYHRFTGGAAWATEYGSAENAKDFAYLYKYSPLHNVKPGTCYPATLVTTADHDDRVVPSHSFKFAATMQAAQGCNKPVLIRIETQGSHGYRPTDKRIAEQADIWAFALANMKPRSPSTAGQQAVRRSFVGEAAVSARQVERQWRTRMATKQGSFELAQRSCRHRNCSAPALPRASHTSCRRHSTRCPDLANFHLDTARSAGPRTGR